MGSPGPESPVSGQTPPSSIVRKLAVFAMMQVSPRPNRFTGGLSLQSPAKNRAACAAGRSASRAR